MYRTLDNLIESCQTNEKVKVILLHGGRNFSVGNDISVFSNVKDVPEFLEKISYMMRELIVGCTMSIAKSVKPIVCVVRGW